MRGGARYIEERAHRVGRQLEHARVDAGFLRERGCYLIEPGHPAGLLLTGGASRRMRRDKATIDFGGVGLAVRVARALSQVAYPVLAVGIEAGTSLPTVDDPREGPLIAFVKGADELRARGYDGPILLCACDIPFVEPALLSHIAASIQGYDP